MSRQPRYLATTLSQKENSRNKFGQGISSAQKSSICGNVVSLRARYEVYVLALEIGFAGVKDTVLNSRDTLVGC